MDLFRKQAIAHRAGRLEGEVSLAQPVSWTIAGTLIVLAVAGVLAALLLIQVPRLVTVPAVVAADGVRLLVPTEARSGMAVMVRPEVVGRELALAGTLRVTAASSVIAPIARQTVAGRPATVALGPPRLPIGTPASATVTLGRQSLLAAIVG